MMDKVEIKTDRILLRDIENTDQENIYKGLSHPEVIKHYGVSYQHYDEVSEQMEWFANPKQKWFAICSLDNQTFFGAGGLNDISEENRKAEIGLWLLPAFWGKGIMQEAIPLICDFGFDHLKLHRIEGFVDSENKNCKRAMSKLDFQFEGTMRECELKSNKYISIDIYSKLNNQV